MLDKIHQMAMAPFLRDKGKVFASDFNCVRVLSDQAFAVKILSSQSDVFRLPTGEDSKN